MVDLKCKPTAEYFNLSLGFSDICFYYNNNNYFVVLLGSVGSSLQSETRKKQKIKMFLLQLVLCYMEKCLRRKLSCHLTIQTP